MKQKWKHPGSLIKKCLRERGIKQAEAGRSMDLPRTTIYAVTAGLVLPTSFFMKWLETQGIGTAEQWAVHTALFKLQEEVAHGKTIDSVLRPKK